MNTLEGTRTLVIGGSSGIGLEVARLALAGGSEVHIASRTKAKLATAQGDLGSEVTTHRLDFTRDRKVEALIRAIGPLDHLVVTAAQGAAGKIAEMPLHVARNLFDDKFWGPYHCVRHAAPTMREGGSITLFSSLTSRRAFEGLSAMAAANGALEALVRSLAHELAPLRVNAILPGAVDTPAHDWMGPEGKAKWIQEMADLVPLGKVGTSEDLARATRELMRNDYISGEIWVIDGGHSLL